MDKRVRFDIRAERWDANGIPLDVVEGKTFAYADDLDKNPGLRQYIHNWLIGRIQRFAPDGVTLGEPTITEVLIDEMDPRHPNYVFR